MKSLFVTAAMSLFIASSAVAQNSTVQDVKKGAEKAGNKTAEVASKGASKVADKEYQDKVGPDGQTIYIDKHSKYYWVNSKGRKIYVEEASLKNK